MDTGYRVYLDKKNGEANKIAANTHNTSQHRPFDYGHTFAGLDENNSRHTEFCPVCSYDSEDQVTKVRTLGKLVLVDLAGSERIERSGVTGARLTEVSTPGVNISCTIRSTRKLIQILGVWIIWEISYKI